MNPPSSIERRDRRAYRKGSRFFWMLSILFKTTKIYEEAHGLFFEKMMILFECICFKQPKDFICGIAVFVCMSGMSPGKAMNCHVRSATAAGASAKFGFRDAVTEFPA